MNFFFDSLILVHLLEYSAVWGCMRTAPGGPSPCMTCTTSQITFSPGDDAVTPTYTGPGMDNAGCLILVVICPDAGAAFTVFMQFNGDTGGPSEPAGVDVEANLTCDNGVWYYQTSTPVDQVECLLAPV